ncbi:hypothetical protein VTP01DRAFT_428 [Rhizomucor pusillus]|uniref:uncharacterized protein n=1 Tax=Rhizomucor pusillus TaxID=4840 RepID=UPI003744A96F
MAPASIKKEMPKTRRLKKSQTSAKPKKTSVEKADVAETRQSSQSDSDVEQIDNETDDSGSEEEKASESSESSESESSENESEQSSSDDDREEEAEQEQVHAKSKQGQSDESQDDDVSEDEDMKNASSADDDDGKDSESEVSESVEEEEAESDKSSDGSSNEEQVDSDIEMEEKEDEEEDEDIETESKKRKADDSDSDSDSDEQPKKKRNVTLEERLPIKGEEGEHEYSVFVGQIPFEATEDDVRELFNQIGKVVDVDLPKYEGSKNRGFGHVKFSKKKDVSKALKKEGDLELKGRTLVIKEAKPIQERKSIAERSKTKSNTMFIGNLPYSATEDDIRRICVKYGNVQDIRHLSQNGVAFVVFNTVDECTKAIDSLSGMRLQGRSLRTDYDSGSKQKGAGGGRGGRGGRGGFRGGRGGRK